MHVYYSELSKLNRVSLCILAKKVILFKYKIAFQPQNI